jgi:hypothetical protein
VVSCGGEVRLGNITNVENEWGDIDVNLASVGGYASPAKFDFYPEM